MTRASASCSSIGSRTTSRRRERRFAKPASPGCWGTDCWWGPKEGARSEGKKKKQGGRSKEQEGNKRRGRENVSWGNRFPAPGSLLAPCYSLLLPCSLLLLRPYNPATRQGLSTLTRRRNDFSNEMEPRLPPSGWLFSLAMRERSFRSAIGESR